MWRLHKEEENKAISVKHKSKTKPNGCYEDDFWTKNTDMNWDKEYKNDVQ
jgi:hypothetical protein